MYVEKDLDEKAIGAEGIDVRGIRRKRNISWDP